MTFAETVAAAINDFVENGYTSQEQLEHWLFVLKQAAEKQAVPKAKMEKMLNEALKAVFTRLVERHGILVNHPGIPTFTLDSVKPKLHAELSRRMLASANLIKLNRDEAISNTLRRLSGWATSIPAGGSDVVKRRQTAEDIKKSINALPFVERRVIIDQSHKLTSAINSLVATDGGAIAARWFSHFRQTGYDYREDHKERDGHVYLIRGSWAQEKGLVKPGLSGYTDAITQPGEEVFCRCKYVYLYHLRQLPEDMLTALGKEMLKRVRVS